MNRKERRKNKKLGRPYEGPISKPRRKGDMTTTATQELTQTKETIIKSYNELCNETGDYFLKIHSFQTKIEEAKTKALNLEAQWRTLETQSTTGTETVALQSVPAETTTTPVSATV